MAKDFADISRLTEAAEVNATNKRESLAKLMKAWESKNAKRALQGTALSTMAVTLAACGGSSTTTTTPVTPAAPANTIEMANNGGVFSLVTNTVSGVSLPSSAAATLYIDDAAGNAYSFVLDADTIGSGKVTFNFADVNDVVTLRAGSDLGSVTAVEIVGGTVDFTAIDAADFNVTSVTVNSTGIFTSDQLLGVKTVNGDGDIVFIPGPLMVISSILEWMENNDVTLAIRVIGGTSALTQAEIDGFNQQVADKTAELNAPAPVVPENQSFTLTTAQDLAAKFTGGDGNDTFGGVVTANGGTGTTIAAGDQLVGGAGTDTLNISVSGAHTGAVTVAAVQTDGIEKVLVSNFNTGAHLTTIDTTLMTGVTNVGLTASSANGDTAFSGMKNFVAAEMRNGSGDLTLTYDGAQVVTGTADVQTLTVSNVTAGTFTADGIETINIMAETAKSTLKAVASDALQTLTVSGTVDLTITDALVFAKTANSTAIDGTLNASSFTGKLAVDVSGSASTLSVATGSGNDTIKFGATLTTNDVVNAGAGNDTVEITGHDGATVLAMKDLKLTSVENFQVTGAGGKNTAVNADGSTVTRYVAVENATTNKDVAFTGLESGATVALNQTVDGQAMGDVTAALKDPAGTADTLTFEVNATSGQGAEVVKSITAANIETINLVSGYVGATATLAGDSNVVTNATFAAATQMNISGDTNLTFSNALTAGKLTNVNAAALKGNLSYIANGVDLTLTSGAGDDTLTFGTTLDAKDKIDGGAGKDTLTATINGLGTTAAPAALNIANVETVSFQATGAASVIDASGISGATVINIGDANAAASVSVTLSKLAGGTKIGLGGLAADKEFKGTVDVSLADASGSADSVTFVLADTDTDDDVDATLKVAATVEQVVIEASKDGTDNNAKLNLADVKSSSVVLTGGNASEVINLGTLSETTTTLNASAFDGLLTVTGSKSADTVSVKVGSANNTIALGAGNDSLTIANLGGDDADGGDGEDTLTATIKGNVTEATTSFETINYIIGDNVQSTVTGANGKGVDVAKVFNLSGGDALTTFAHDLVSPTALTTYNMAAFTGASTALTVAATANDLSAVTVTGSAGTDSVTVTTNNSDFAVKAMTGVETLVLNVAGGASTFDVSKTSGLKTIKVDDDNTARVITLTDVTTGTDVEITTGVTATNVVVDLKDKALAANSVNLTVGTTVGTVNIDVEDVETVNLINKTGASTVDLGGVLITEADKFAKLIVTGDKALTINALHADVNFIDASGMTTGGSVVQTARAGTTAADYKGTAGADTFIMANTSDVIVAGAGADTLDVNLVAVLGGIVVDLSKDDVVVSANGVLNTTVQSGFTNVDLAGYTGGFGAVVTAHKDGSTITGTAATDQITGGAGDDTIIVATAGAANNDVINGGGGTDTLHFAAGNNSLTTDASLVGVETITLGETANIVLTNQTEAFLIVSGKGANEITSGSGADTIQINAAADFGDTITAFTLGAAGDKLDFNVAVNGTTYVEITGNTGAFNSATTRVVVLDTNTAAADGTGVTAAEMLTALTGADLTDDTLVAGDKFYAALTSNATGAANVEIYLVEVAAGATSFETPTLVATLAGITDLTAAVAENFI
jgi:hypothetical protein